MTNGDRGEGFPHFLWGRENGGPEITWVKKKSENAREKIILVTDKRAADAKVKVLIQWW